MILISIVTYVAATVGVFSWDIDFTRWLQRQSLDTTMALREWLFWMGLRGVAGILFTSAILGFWLKNQRLKAVFIGVIAVPDVFNVLLRYIVGRPRPTHDLVEVIGGPQGYGFPSGTAVHVLLFSGLLLYLLDNHIKSRFVAYTLWALATLYILLSGAWVIYNGRHWLTDVAGGYLYGTLYLLVLVVAYRRARTWIQAGGASRLPDMLPSIFRRPVRYVFRLIA